MLSQTHAQTVLVVLKTCVPECIVFGKVVRLSGMGRIRTARVIVYIVFGNVVPKRYGAYTYRDPAVDDPALRRLLENICFFSVITFERPRTGRLLASGIRGGFRRRPNHVLGSFDFLLDSLADRGLHLVACLAD